MARKLSLVGTKATTTRNIPPIGAKNGGLPTIQDLLELLDEGRKELDAAIREAVADDWRGDRFRQQTAKGEPGVMLDRRRLALLAGLLVDLNETVWRRCHDDVLNATVYPYAPGDKDAAE